MNLAPPKRSSGTAFVEAMLNMQGNTQSKTRHHSRIASLQRGQPVGGGGGGGRREAVVQIVQGENMFN